MVEFYISSMEFLCMRQFRNITFYMEELFIAKYVLLYNDNYKILGI